MAIPDLCNPTKVEAKNAKLAVTTSAQAIVSNAAFSNKTLRVVSLYVSNVDGINDASVTVSVYDGSVTRHICNTVSVPADSTLSVITREDVLYLMEGDALRLTASNNGDLEAIVSYEEIS
jgi:hypothetical protein